MAKKIKQQVNFSCKPSELFNIILDSKLHTKVTGAKASVSKKVGGKFTAYDGYCYGKNLKITANKLIVQSWRATDWPEKHFSTLSFEFQKTDTGTKMIFSQENIPDDQFESIKKGWVDFYFNPIKDYLKSIKK